ncbi:MAG TPA: hypothetical protein VMU43_13910 [Candidatus Acidoferrum sp.]|nr:hypothetical protein [Candidatus Acidoferrum sp.]
MPLTSAKRAWLAVAALLCLAIAGGALYYHHLKQPLPGPAQVPGAPPSLISLLPSDAPVIAYINVDALRASKDSALISLLLTPAPKSQADAEYKAFVDGTGFDYARDLNRAAVAMWPAGLAQTPESVQQDRTLGVADGHFNQEKITAYALHMRGHQEASGTSHVFVVPGAPPVAFEFLSPTRIRIASGPDPAAILRTSAPGASDAAMQERIARVAGAPLFAVARTDNLPDSFYAPLHNTPQLAHLARSIQGLTLAGKPSGDLLTVTLDAQCSSIKDSFELATLIDGFRMLGSVALQDPKMQGQMTREQAAFLHDVVSRTLVTHQDKWVRLSLDITPQMLGTTSSSATDPPAARSR